MIISIGSYKAYILQEKLNSKVFLFTCSISTTETLEKGVKYVQSSAAFTVNFKHISHIF